MSQKQKNWCICIFKETKKLLNFPRGFLVQLARMVLVSVCVHRILASVRTMRGVVKVGHAMCCAHNIQEGIQAATQTSNA